MIDIISGTLIDLASSFFTVATTIFFLNLEYLRTVQAGASQIAAPENVTG